MKSNLPTPVAVLGLGTMGHGIAQTFAAAGVEVRGYDEVAAARDNLYERIESNLRQMAEAGLVEISAIATTLARVEVYDSEEDAVRPAQFVIEAVAEDLPLKQALFERLESFVSPQTIVATNSSSCQASQCAVNMKQPQRAVAAHWFNPPHIVPVVEVVPGERTSPETVDTTIEVLKGIGKVPIRLNMELDGFLVNRIQVAMHREVWDLMERGVASPDQIDAAVRGSIGIRLAAAGPLAICDFGGLDILARVYERLAPQIRSDTTVPESLSELDKKGDLGLKTGKGIYEYPPDRAEAAKNERDERLLALVKMFCGGKREA